MDADFLAFYRIDLRDPDNGLDAARFLALAFRCFNFRGSMRQELEIESRNNEPSAPVSAPRPVVASAAVPAANAGEKWVSPAEMKHLFPDLF